MGKGDRKTRKGKIAMGSFGKRRPKKGTLPTGSANEKQGAGRVKAGEKQVDQKMTKEKK